MCLVFHREYVFLLCIEGQCGSLRIVPSLVYLQLSCASFALMIVVHTFAQGNNIHARR